MKFVILEGSPRADGNTAALTGPFAEELRALGAGTERFRLYDMKIQPCIACRACQKDHGIFGCSQQDDAQRIFDAVLAADILVLATPIYSWYCPAPMKALLDRFVYGMNKFYGDTVGPSLWEGRALALLVTCGYRPEKGADLFEEGIRRYAKHSRLVYRGMHAERHLGYNTVFMDEEKEARVRAFARALLEPQA